MVTVGRNISELNEWYASKLSFPALVRQSDHFVVPLLLLCLEIVTPGQEADFGGFASAAAPRGGVSPHTLPALVRQCDHFVVPLFSLRSTMDQWGWLRCSRFVGQSRCDLRDCS